MHGHPNAMSKHHSLHDRGDLLCFSESWNLERGIAQVASKICYMTHDVLCAWRWSLMGRGDS